MSQADPMSLSFFHNLPESGLTPQSGIFLKKLNKNKIKQNKRTLSHKKKKTNNVFAYSPGYPEALYVALVGLVISCLNLSSRSIIGVHHH